MESFHRFLEHYFKFMDCEHIYKKAYFLKISNRFGNYMIFIVKVKVKQYIIKTLVWCNYIYDMLSLEDKNTYKRYFFLNLNLFF